MEAKQQLIQLPLIIEKKNQQITKANKEALAICDKMEQLGFSNFSGLKSKISVVTDC